MAYEFKKTPEELMLCSQYWINRMLEFLDARGQAQHLAGKFND